MEITSIGIDLGKATFHLVALDGHVKVTIRKKFSRKQLLAYTANLAPVLVGIVARPGAHCIGAKLREQGHDVRLIPVQFVKPFLKSNRNDFLDAEAIAEAVARKNMRFVPIKTDTGLRLLFAPYVRFTWTLRELAPCLGEFQMTRAWDTEKSLAGASDPQGMSVSANRRLWACLALASDILKPASQRKRQVLPLQFRGSFISASFFCWSGVRTEAICDLAA